MTEALAAYTSTPERPLDCGDHQDHRLSQRLVVRFHRLRALDHAKQVDRDGELDFLDQLQDDAVNGAWVETIWNPKPTKREREAGQQRHDHKRDLRRALYERGIVSQFLARQSQPDPDDAADEADTDAEAEAPKDDKAINALRDLLFRLGCVDDRLRHVTDLADEPILVGIHLRQQRVSNRRPGAADRTQMVEVLTALHTSNDPERPWRLDSYDHHAHDWRPQAAAEAAFARRAIGREGHARHEEGAPLARQHIESALKVLPSDRPLITFLDTEACRTIWPGLQNVRFGKGPLPGDDLRTETRSVAVVAINTSYGEVPTPVENTASPRKNQTPAEAPEASLPAYHRYRPHQLVHRTGLQHLRRHRQHRWRPHPLHPPQRRLGSAAQGLAQLHRHPDHRSTLRGARSAATRDARRSVVPSVPSLGRAHPPPRSPSRRRRHGPRSSRVPGTQHRARPDARSQPDARGRIAGRSADPCAPAYCQMSNGPGCPLRFPSRP
nr:RNaseH domain-containing protein [Streptomyces rubrogriseus]